MPIAKRISLESIRKEEILKAALTNIAEKGSANVTLDSIAKVAGFSKGGITYYYSSKEALFKEVFQHFFSFKFQRGEDEVAKQKDPLQRLLSYAWIYDPTNYQSEVKFPLLFDVMSMATHDSEYSQAFRDWVADWVAIFIDIIEEGKASGQFQIEDAEDTARLISAAMQGVATRWVLGRESHSTEWAQKSFEHIVTALLNIRQEPTLIT